MARLVTSVLGKVSGALGEVTFRLRNGKNIIGMRPISYAPPDDEDSVARRQRFRLAAKLAGAIVSVPVLKSVWERETLPGMSAFNNVVKTDFKLIGTESITNLTVIVPGFGFVAECTEAAVAGDSVTVTVAQLGAAAGVDLALEPKVGLVAVLCLEAPTSPALEPTRFVGLMSEPQQLATDSSMTFTVNPGAHDSALISSYGTKKALFALVTLDENEKPVRYSDTFQSK